MLYYLNVLNTACRLYLEALFKSPYGKVLEAIKPMEAVNVMFRF